MTIKDQSYGIIPVYRHNGENLFLLIHHHAGHWAFPKGHPEAHETTLETAKREFEEETGVKEYEVDARKKFEEDYYFKREKDLIRKNVGYFIGFVKHPEVKIQKSEVKNYLWVDFNDAIKTMTFKQGREMLKLANKYLEQTHPF